MKRFFIFSLFILAGSNAFSQATTCNNLKIISPEVAKPTNASLVSTTCSTMVVKWQGHANQTYVVQGMFKNAATNQWDTTQGANIICDNSFNCSATIPVIAGRETMWSVEANEVLSNGVTYTSYALRSALDYPIAACGSAIPIKFSGRVFLQGAYNTSTGSMENALNSLGILQNNATTQPYNNAAFNYTGTENVGTGFFAAHPDIVDWVLIELRNANLPTNIVARRAAFVKQDGTLVDVDGTNDKITFPNVAQGYYYVTVLHRNHLGIRTESALHFASGESAYDFSINGNNAYHNQYYTSTVKIGNIWAMRAGNSNANIETRYQGPNNDRASILTELGNNDLSGLTGYYPADLNMNGQVKYQGPNNDRAFLLSIPLANDELKVLRQQLPQ